MKKITQVLDEFVNYFHKHGWTAGTYKYYVNLTAEITKSERELLNLRATLEEIESIVNEFEKSRSAVSVLLYRIRDRIALSKGK